MSDQLRGQTAIVVGASSGMGRAIAVALARGGAHVVAAARREERLVELEQQLRGEDCSIETCVADVSNPDDVRRLIEQARQRTGRIEFLVYATGTNLPARALSVLSHDNWLRLIETNLTGAFACTQAVLPVMRAARNGLIVYLSSGCVQMPDVSGVAYQASKHGLVGLAHGTRIEEKSNGIRTTVLFPGLCDTEILTQRPVPTPREVLDQALAPEDVAEAVLFLARLPSRAVVPEMQLLPARL
ncbi:MAG: SDR family oxidoreductase [Candidatus Saccharimonas sp.]|nr:SDR family oxidoreductase [Planctomycetaceae bacterium]